MFKGLHECHNAKGKHMEIKILRISVTKWVGTEMQLCIYILNICKIEIRGEVILNRNLLKEQSNSACARTNQLIHKYKQKRLIAVELKLTSNQPHQ